MIDTMTGAIVSTKRRKSLTVLSGPDKSGWLVVRTLSGKVIDISKADVTRVETAPATAAPASAPAWVNEPAGITVWSVSYRIGRHDHLFTMRCMTDGDYSTQRDIPRMIALAHLGSLDLSHLVRVAGMSIVPERKA